MTGLGRKRVCRAGGDEGAGMKAEPATTVARGLLVAASLGAVIWSGAVLGMPKVPRRGQDLAPLPQPQTRSILADLVLKNARHGSVSQFCRSAPDYPALALILIKGEGSRFQVPGCEDTPETWNLKLGTFVHF